MYRYQITGKTFVDVKCREPIDNEVVAIECNSGYLSETKACEIAKILGMSADSIIVSRNGRVQYITSLN